MNKKLLSLLLTVLIVLSVMTVTVFAVGAEEHNIMLTTQAPSAEIQAEGIIWIKEESYDVNSGKVRSTWYGLENINGEFPEGSRFSVRLCDQLSDSEDFKRYESNVDNQVGFKLKKTDHYIIFNAVDKNNAALQLQNPVTLYVQISDAWDEEDIEAYFINEGKDEKVMIERSHNVVSPDGSNGFIRLTVNHFGAPLLIAEASSFAASVWVHYQPAVIIVTVLIIGIVAAILIKKKNESK